MDDSRAPAREINPETFKPKMMIDKPSGKFVKTPDRIEKYLDDHMAYLEGNLEKEERRKAFNIIEQMFAQSREDGLRDSEDPTLKRAVTQLEKYFSDTQNTEFFDKSVDQ